MEGLRAQPCRVARRVRAVGRRRRAEVRPKAAVAAKNEGGEGPAGLEAGPIVVRRCGSGDAQLRGWGRVGGWVPPTRSRPLEVRARKSWRLASGSEGGVKRIEGVDCESAREGVRRLAPVW